MENNKEKKINEPKKINKILDLFIEKANLKNGLNEIKVKKAWEKSFGLNINKYTLKIKLKNSNLIINLSSAALKEEMNYEKKKILKILKKELGEEIIKKIIIR
tara:strand:- start:494 stop:802 length:309 start_codon:yes stop_codon:yes gene_type:complete